MSKSKTTKKLEPWQQRVIAEKAGNDAKIAKLQEFLRLDTLANIADRANGISKEERVQLSDQVVIMQELSGVLQNRIDLF
jgi:hypothetical protein